MNDLLLELLPNSENDASLEQKICYEEGKYCQDMNKDEL